MEMHVDLKTCLDKVDLVLVMSVKNGHGGHEFITNSIDKDNFIALTLTSVVALSNAYKVEYIIK